MFADANTPNDDFAPETMLFDDVPVVVSATRKEQSLLDVPNSVTVITQDEIRSSGATSIPEVLEIVPGLDMMRISRSDTNMSARGFVAPTSSNMLVMVDGRSIYADFFGVVLWDRVNVGLMEIERIEVVRGPSSALYGANAFLGTINIVTKRAADLPTAQLYSGIGPRGSFVDATAARTHGSTSVKSSVGYRLADNFRNDITPALNGQHRRDQTGLRAQRFNSTVEHELATGGRALISGGMSNSKADLYSTVGLWDYQGPNYYAQLVLEKGPWRFQTFIDHSDLDAGTLPIGLPAPPVPLDDRLKTTVFDMEAQRELELGDHHLVMGLNTRRVATDSPALLGSREEETLYSGFLQDQYHLTDWVTATLAARLDHHPKGGLNASPRVSLLFKPNEKSRVWVAFSRAFRSPTQVLNYLSLDIAAFTPAPTTLVTLMGNENLDPSWSTSYEAGVQVYPHPRLSVQADLFYEQIQGLTKIVPLAAGPPVLQSFINDGRMTNWGGETWIEFKQSDALRGFASYSFQQSRGDFELSTPRQKATAGVRGTLATRFRYALTGVFVGRTNFEEATPTLPFTRIPSRLQLHTYAGIQLTQQLEVGITSRNTLGQVRRQYPLGDEIGGEYYLTGRVEF